MQYNGLIEYYFIPISLSLRWLEEGSITDQNFVDYYMDETGTVSFKFIKDV